MKHIKLKTLKKLVSGIVKDTELENLIQKRHLGYKNQVCKNAMFFGERNKPDAQDDKIEHYLEGILPAGYEETGNIILQRTQVESHFPEAKIDAVHYTEQLKQLEAKKKELSDKNKIDKYELSNYQPGSMIVRLLIVGISTFFTIAGEIPYFTKVFQLIVDNLLFALFFSISVSVSFAFISHFAPFLYKRQKIDFWRRVVLWGTLLIVTGAFTGMAILRSQYLALHGMHVNPAYFVMFNLILFMVAAVVSFFALPSWEEFKQNLTHMKLNHSIQKRENKQARIEQQIAELKAYYAELMKYRHKLSEYANKLIDQVIIQCKETYDAFKTKNLACRNDGCIPDCFSHEAPVPNIPRSNFSYTPSNEITS